jgi:hypothetical protein
MKVAAIEVKAPSHYDTVKFSIFLAGAIDQGQAEDWQSKVARSLDDLDLTILNPRRDDWDSSWEQSIDNPQFKEQVLWELDAQEAADMVIFVFTRDSKAPITFLELGIFGTNKDSMVCCEEGFYRQGNLDIVCEKYNIPIYHNLDEMIVDLHEALAARV